MNHLPQLVNRWLEAEARAEVDVDARATAVMQSLPAPVSRRDLVAAVMAALAPASLWARRPVRHLVAAMLVALGVGVIAVANSIPTWPSIATSLSVWWELGRRLVLLVVAVSVDLVNVVDTVWQAAASSATVTTLFGVLPWLATGLFLAGSAAMGWISLWRDEENLRHA